MGVLGVPISTSYLPKSAPKKGGKWLTYLSYKYIYIHTYKYIYIHIHIYIYICMYMYLWMYMYMWFGVCFGRYFLRDFRKFEVSARTMYLVYVQPICVAHGAKGWDQMHHMHGAKADLQVYLWRVVYMYNYRFHTSYLSTSKND